MLFQHLLKCSDVRIWHFFDLAFALDGVRPQRKLFRSFRVFAFGRETDAGTPSRSIDFIFAVLVRHSQRRARLSCPLVLARCRSA
jgi:hypothetical protein